MKQATRNVPTTTQNRDDCTQKGLREFKERMNEERRKVGWPVLNKSDKPNYFPTGS